MTMRSVRLTVVGAALLALVAVGAVAQDTGPRPLAPLPARKAPDAKRADLGRHLFFDARLSGDATISCATCHDPAKGWADGMAMSVGYPGALYFRNTPTVLNAAHGKLAYWDGRLPASDLPTVVRDHIAEAHFLQADGRLVIERMRQIPVYEEAFADAFGGEPSYGKILNSVTAFMQTLESRDVPFDAYLRGDDAAISDAAKRGKDLFEGKAGCIGCHDGPMLSDGKFHGVGLPPSAEIFATPERHITYRRFLKTLGVPRYAQLREDIGREAVTKDRADRGLFRTPTLRELTRTAPYMHDGSLATLADVVDFYDRGGGDGVGKDAALAPLGLTDAEKADLVAFLESLSGAEVTVEVPEMPPYELRTLGDN